MKQLTTYLPLLFLLLLGACKNAKTGSAAQLTDDALMDTVQRRTFNYFWEVGGQAVLGRQLGKPTPWLTERHGYDPTS